MAEHAMAYLGQALRDNGLEVLELDGWKENEPGYYWTNQYGQHFGYLGHPNGHLVHHTATSGYTPYVKNSRGQTKANAWLGLLRGNRLYQSGGGVPTIVLASAGPADYSAGKGVKELLTNFVVNDVRFRGPQSKNDTSGFYGNRYYWSTEVIHKGDGTPLDWAVWDLLIAYCAVLAQLEGWTVWRNVGHLDHTRRKIDPRFAQGAPYTIAAIQDAANSYVPIGGSDMYAIGPGHNLNLEDVSYVQKKLEKLGFYSGDPNGQWNAVTEQAVRDFQASIGAYVDGIVWGYVGAELDFALAEQAGGGGGEAPDLSNYSLKSHSHLVPNVRTSVDDS